MSVQDRTLVQSVVQNIAASRPGAWFFSRTLHHLDRIFLPLTGGRATLSSLLSGIPVVILTTTGAKSGLPRTLPLLCIRDEHDPDTIALVASNWGRRSHPAWYYNLRANPRAQCSLGGQAKEYLAHEAIGEEYERLWQRAVDAYVGFPLYKQRAGQRHIPIIVMRPLER